MGDDLAWDDDEYEVPEIVTKVKKLNEEDDEDAKPKASAGGAKKKDTKKKDSHDGGAGGDHEELDPVAEKLRKQRIVEESDLAAAREAFGGAGKNIDEMVPKTEPEFMEYAELVSAKYFRPFERDQKYLAMIKAALKHALANVSSAGIKEVESAVVNARNSKMKEEKEVADKAKKAAQAASKAKKEVKVDNELDDADMAAGNYRSVDDDYDFM